MKLTKSQLKKIIKEELDRPLAEADMDMMSVARDIMLQHGDKLRAASDESLEIIAFKKAQDLGAEDTFSAAADIYNHLLVLNEKRTKDK
tara:strand:- start:61 stop:327 length:267 start_codon:yes stop_codon:yes gene_type:complete